MRNSTKILLILISLFIFESYPYPVEAKEKRSCFSPHQECDRWLIEHLLSARKSIDAAIYMITSRQIVETLTKIKRRGIRIRILMDQESAYKRYSKYRYLKKRGFSVRLLVGLPVTGRPTRRGIMHHKFVIIDGQVVITGSFNWTASAARYNYENLTLINDPETVRDFQKEFDSLWIKAR